MDSLTSLPTLLRQVLSEGEVLTEVEEWKLQSAKC